MFETILVMGDANDGIKPGNPPASARAASRRAEGLRMIDIRWTQRATGVHWVTHPSRREGDSDTHIDLAGVTPSTAIVDSIILRQPPPYITDHAYKSRFWDENQTLNRPKSTSFLY